MASQVGRFSGKAEANKGGSGKGNGSAEEKGTGRGLAGEGHKGRGQSKGNCCGKRKTRVVVDERSDGESHVEGDYEVGESSLRPMHTVTYERALHSCCEGDYMKKPAPDAKPTIHFVRGKRT